MLEREEEEQQVHQRSFSNFFFRPFLIGKDLLTIEKFGLVQYVRHNYLIMYHLIFICDNFVEFDICWLTSDDSEDILCILSTVVGGLWSLRRWRIQMVLRVCMLAFFVQSCICFGIKIPMKSKLLLDAALS